ncbi:hypothetical protein HanPSC8_Chr07g0293231 [Helianthus annuus]|nr:hypothetical protein HanPSC8_Chr07g0293231 [Helianthus annuus]
MGLSVVQSGYLNFLPTVVHQPQHGCFLVNLTDDDDDDGLKDVLARDLSNLTSSVKILSRRFSFTSLMLAKAIMQLSEHSFSRT